MNLEGNVEDVPPPSTKGVRVWLVEDNGEYRRSLARVLDRTPGFACTLACESCEEALQQVAMRPAPDVLLLDIGLPGIDGVSAVRQFKDKFPAAQIIMLTSFDDHDRIFRAVCAGANGYLLKTASVGKIIEGLHEAMAGGAPMSPQVARAVLTMFARSGAAKPAAASTDYGLSTREREILEQLVAGRTIKEVAAQLGVSYHTIDTHLRRIYEKLDVHTRQGAVAKALHERLLE